jgi:putative addiction module killer protein
MEQGNFGDWHPCTEGVCELRIDVGPGYRVYYFQYGKRVVVLLIGGDKRGQQADIRKAIACKTDYLQRNRLEEPS